MNKNLKIMYGITFLQGLVFYAPISAIFRVERGLNLSEFFFLEFILLVMVMIMEIPWGYFADRYGYKKTLILSYIIFFMGRVVLLYSDSFVDFLIQSIICAIGIAGASGCDVALIHNSCENENKEKVFGKYNYYGSLGFIVASLTSYIFIRKSIETAVIATIITYGISIILVLFIKDKQEIQHEEHEKLDIRNSFKDFNKVKYIFIFVISIALISEVSYGINVSLGQIHFKNIGIKIEYLGYVSAISHVIGLLSSKTYMISEKIGQKNTLNLLLSTMIICIISLIFTSNKIISIISISLIGGLIGIMYPIITDIKNKSITKNRATILSVYSMIGSLSSGLLNILMGSFADINLKYAFLYCLIIMVIAISGVYVYHKNNESVEYNEKN